METLQAGGQVGTVSQQIADSFVAMLPAIAGVIQYAFRRQRADRRQELAAGAIANAYVGFTRLVARGRPDAAHPTVLAWFGVRQVCDGRRVGCRRNSKDALSDYAQRRRNFSVVGLDDEIRGTRGWEPIVIEDKHASPADIAAFRIDFADWLSRLRPRLRAVALVLAVGNTPLEASRQFRLSKARISQFRRELRASWNAFQSEPLAA
jgi:hypothetical protein